VRCKRGGTSRTGKYKGPNSVLDVSAAALDRSKEGSKQAPNKHRKLGNGTRAKAHFSLRIEFLPFLRVHGVYGV
jgi:hypothetical protein